MGGPRTHPASVTARRAAVAAGVLLTLGIVALHSVYHGSAGPLWRDAVNSVNVASLPTAAEVYAHLRYDSFPPAWIGLVYAWQGAGLAGSDAGYRRLGLAVGLATLAVVWWTGWRLGIGPPLIMLLLFGLSPSVIIYGDTVRGYGLAALAILWSAGATWAFIQRPTWGAYAVAQIAAIVAAQTHFGNGIPLLGIGVGAAAVCWRRRNWRLLLAALGIGAVAATVLFIVNYPILRYMMQAGQQEQHAAITLGWILRVFAAGLAPGLPSLALSWALCAALAASGLAAALLMRRDDADADRAVFAILLLAITLGGTFPAYVRTGVPTNYWHYLSLFALSALACEVGIAALVRRFRHGAWARVAGVSVAALLTLPAAADTVRLRMTSLDLAARAIEEAARPGDLAASSPGSPGSPSTAITAVPPRGSPCPTCRSTSSTCTWWCASG